MTAGPGPMAPGALLGWVLAASAPLAAATDLSAEKLWQLSRIAGVQVSPDARSVATVVQGHDIDANLSHAAIWLFPLQSSRPARLLTAAIDATARPAWHADGSALYAIGPHEGRARQIVRFEAADGTATGLTRLPVPVRRLQALADGGAIIFEAPTFPDLDADFERVAARLAAMRADPTQARITESRILRYLDRYLTDGLVPHLFRLDLASGEITDLTPGFDQVTAFDGFEWDASADGRSLAWSANVTPAPYRTLDFDVFVRELSTGAVRNLTRGDAGDDVRPVFSPDGRRLAYGRHDRAATASAFRRLAVIDLDAGTRRDLPRALPSHAFDWAFSGDGTRLYFHAEDQGKTHLYAWHGDRVRRVVAGGSTEGVQPAGRGLLVLRHDFTQPPDLWLHEPGTEPRRVTAINDQRLRGVRFGRYDSVTFTGGDGDRVQMYVAYPRGWRRGQRYPGVVLAHGGPFAAWNDGFSFRWHPGILAARGYVVALPNVHGSTGFGQAFADSILGNHGRLPADDALAAADWLVANAGVDARRLAVAGGSYGGYLAALLTGMSDRFRAAIVHAGVYDIGQQFAADAHWTREDAYGDAPWTDPVRLGTWSPSRFVPQMDTPTLILHGERDFRVPVTQGINLHGALTGKGVPSRIVVFPDEHHWITRPQAGLLWWREVLDWLDRWTGPVDASAAP